jgi:diacylglycerol kinase
MTTILKAHEAVFDRLAPQSRELPGRTKDTGSPMALAAIVPRVLAHVGVIAAQLHGGA